ncbi:MAG: S9 family peptidase [Planctomycetes bacterium]|nr:S9 family peptidase [Planctomycetota bacterium]
MSHALLRRFSAVLVLASAALAEEPKVLTPHRVAELKSVGGALMSPDGRHVAYTLSVPRKPLSDDDGGNRTELWVLDVSAGNSRAFVGGKSELSGVSWTPDGAGLAFLAKRGDDKHNALYVLPLAGGEAQRAAALATGISGYSLAPDSKRVALLAADAVPDARKKEQDKGFKQEIYEEDWSKSSLWLATLFDASAKPTQVELPGSVRDVKWSPVDDRLLIAQSPTPLVDDDMMRTRVSVIDLAGKTLATFDNPGKLGAISWSPDGKRVGLQSAADLNDPSAGRFLFAQASGGALADPLPGYAGDVVASAWRDADTVKFVAAHGVWSAFEELGLASSGAPKTLVPGGGPILQSVSLSKDGQSAAFVASTPTHPPEVFVMSAGEKSPRRMTTSNPWLAEFELAKQEVVEFKARDGLALQGVLIRPLDEKPGERYPLILYVHGGPESHHSNGWQTNYGNPAQVAAARGFAVFHVNYRGSTGLGVEFSKLSQGDPAGAEFDDLIDGIDHLIASGLVDKDKVGVTGGSYGGYATAWLSTAYSHRIAAGVMFVGISDKVSKVGTTDIPDEEYLVHARHRPWEKWQFLLERSPIWYAGKSRTPLLILHGKDDPRVNPGQSRELYRHLQMHGNSVVRLVLYPGEGHGNRKACAKLDYALRSMQWFEHYLKGPGGEAPAWDLDYEEPKQ